MILAVSILILAGGALVAWGLGAVRPDWSRWAALSALIADLALALVLFARTLQSSEVSGLGAWVDQIDLPWIATLDVRFHLAADGLSVLLLLLTPLLGICAVLASWKDDKERVGFFHFHLLLTLAGVAGVFSAIDLILFYLFWELMIVPMYFLIAIWGHEGRRRASLEFFVFTQASSLLMLLSILGLAFMHVQSSGSASFEYTALVESPLSRAAGALIFLGFFAAFGVKLPVVPLHVWLPDAHTEAPTAGSVLLAGLLLKTGGYGFIRFVLPLLPEASSRFAPAMMLLAVVGIVYAAIAAFGQRDLKRLVAFSSINHLGFVLLGAFAQSRLALEGALIQMLAHGLGTGALFILVGALQERTGTRDIEQMGGLFRTLPKMGTAALFLCLAALGLPGFGGFVGELLVLLGSFRASPALTVIAAGGLVLSLLYSLRLFQAIFQGPERGVATSRDLDARESMVLGAMVVLLLGMGVYPKPLLEASTAALGAISGEQRP
jgi:NADH-quinone oxidoreductase subunit M